MNELLKKIKSVKLSKKNIYLIVSGVLVLVLLLAGNGSETEDECYYATDSSQFSAQYIKSTEKELASIIRRIEGAGEVKVMLTLESCYENVYAKSYETDEQNDKEMQEKRFNEEYVIVKNGSGVEQCLVIKVFEPKVKGVAVICQGGDNVGVRKAITETVCALFDISSASVSVTKMN